MEKKLFNDEEMRNIMQEITIKKKVVFKEYSTDQSFIFPHSSDDYISKDHIARLINVIIDRMDISFIINTYNGGGTSSYSPRMLLKVWILGFIYRIYTSRPLAKALRENIAFIWISGHQTVDFRTLNNFRLRLKDDIKKVFKQIVMLGIELGIISGKNVFVDHTKLEANSNKHKIVWKKQVDKRLDNIDSELDKLFEYIDNLNVDDDKKYGDDENDSNKIEDFSKEQIDNIIEKINTNIKSETIDRESGKEIKKKLRRTKELIDKKKEYSQKIDILNGRNSFSKTDNDSVGMMQKDKVNIKPSYNEGIATEQNFILDYIDSQNAGDNVSFKELMDGVIDNTGVIPENAHADSAYGTEENSEYLKEKGIKNYLKFSTFVSENSRKWHRDKIRKEDFLYDAENDCYICFNREELHFERIKKVVSSTGFESKLKIYKAKEESCKNCKFKQYCTLKSSSREIQMNENYEKHKEEMRKNLKSDNGIKLRKKRGNEVESTFGHRKYNDKFYRFNLRGLEKIKIESGLYYCSYNLKKVYSFIVNKIKSEILNKNRNALLNCDTL